MPLLAASVTSWTLVAAFHQGKVYRRAEEGPIDRLRASGIIAAPAWAVRQVVLFPSQYPGVMPYLLEERVVEVEECRPGARGLPGCRREYVYNKVSPPFLAARDYTIRVDLLRDGLTSGGDFLLTWNLSRRRGPPPGSATRMRANAGSWRLWPAGAGTGFEYQLSADPGGWIPSWVVNRANAREIPGMVGAVEAAAQAIARARK